MRCVACGHRSAQLKVAKSVGRVQENLWLCDPCARRLGIVRPRAAYTAIEILSGLFEGVDDRAATELTCPSCGMTAHNLRLHGRTGCERCYEVFRPLIQELIADTAGSARHRGRYPRYLHAIKQVLVDRTVIREQLGLAVAEENYEEAARLRDLLYRFELEAEESRDTP